MAARHLPINGGQHEGVPAGICMVKLDSGILRHNHWGVMRWRSANAQNFASNLSTTLPKDATVRAVECWASTATARASLMCGAALGTH